MIYIVTLLPSALLVLFLFCAVRSLRDRTNSWPAFALLSGLMLGILVMLLVVALDSTLTM